MSALESSVGVAPFAAPTVPGSWSAIVLVCDDATRRLIADAFPGARVREARDREHALQLWRSLGADLVVVDLGLANGEGLRLLQELRRWSSTPVIVVTDDSRIESLVEGLAAGADDYLVKPVHPLELQARTNVALRRTLSPVDSGDRLEFPSLVIDLGRRNVAIDGRAVHLSPREFDLLAVMAGDPARAFSRGQLLDLVFADDFGERREATVTENVRRLRAKLQAADSPAGITTVRGVGYRFDP